MLFNEIPGNNKIKEELINNVKNERISHALLFYGQQGGGQLALAIAYARYINCEKKRDNDSCGLCSSCIKYKTISHPDLHLVFPVIKQNNTTPPVSDSFIHSWRDFVLQNPYLSINNWISLITRDQTKNKTGVIYKDEAISIQKKIRLKNYEAKYKVVLLWMPERMNREMANKILKTIEEPPERTIFLFVAEKPAEILPTIYSRLQKIKINRFTKQDLEKHFKTKEIKEERLSELLLITGRDLGKIEQLVNEGETTDELSFFEEFTSWMRFIYKSDITQITKWCSTISVKGRQEQSLFILYSIKIIRECLLFNLSAFKLVSASQKEQGFIKKFAPFIHQENIFLIVGELEKSNYYLKRNANTKILFYAISLKMIKYLKLKCKFVNKQQKI